MSAAIARRPSPRIGRPGSRTDSPMDPKKNIWKSEDSQGTHVEHKDSKHAGDVETSQPLAPPRRLGQPSDADTPDYFSGPHSTTHFSLEPNPFEQSFGNPPTETPGKSLLPPVAALTSPALPGTTSAGGFNWSNSLRSGPLSPAMLAGPAGPSDYFDSIGRGFPTPNESSLRTGLTPGGGGSMFPAPSPNSQVILQLQSGGATPSTLDFHRTALNVARKNGVNAPTSNPQETEQLLQQSTSMNVSKSAPQPDPFAHHDATDAANGLFMLAKGAQANSNQFSVPSSQSMSSHIHTHDSSANAARLRNGSGSVTEVNGDISDSAGEQVKPSARGKGKKATSKATNSTNGRRKADDAHTKGQNKKSKGNSGFSNVDPHLDNGDSDDQEETKVPQNETNAKKMTDEEKRKNFLERNRVAALKCRQRKKQWLANLQTKVEIYSSENDALSSTVTQLREEIVNLKTLLLAHKDCPVSQAQGLGGLMVNGIPGDFNPHSNPYGMAMQTGAPGIPTQGMPRR